jgi:cytochrome c peroxidase
MFIRHALSFPAALLLLVACGDADPSGTTTTPVNEPTAPTPSVDAFPGVTAALTINPTGLPNYAAPVWPAHYDATVQAQNNAPAGNPVTDRGATLGRVLFHDRQLSINGAVSCASCHHQANSLTDTARLSAGFNTVDRTDAHSMRLGNARFYTAGQAFWDRRAATLEAQATQPIRNAVEMGFDDAHGGINALITRMYGLRYYPELFRLVYGDTVITEDRMQRAIAQYVRSVVSVNSRFDDGFARAYNPQLPDRGLNAPFQGFTAEENRGKVLFLTAPPQGGGGCAACHVPPSFALAANSRSNGLDANETRLFKSPSLKGVGVTGPFMHDGRLATLEQVVEHYMNGVQLGPALDNKLRLPNGTPLRLAFTPADKAALVAFMRTLTDTTCATDARFSSPFRR